MRVIRNLLKDACDMEMGFHRMSKYIVKLLELDIDDETDTESEYATVSSIDFSDLSSTETTETIDDSSDYSDVFLGSTEFESTDISLNSDSSDNEYNVRPVWPPIGPNNLPRPIWANESIISPPAKTLPKPKWANENEKKGREDSEKNAEELGFPTTSNASNLQNNQVDQEVSPLSSSPERETYNGPAYWKLGLMIGYDKDGNYCFYVSNDAYDAQPYNNTPSPKDSGFYM